MSNPKITIKDVAKYVGVSVTTVSHVLSNKGKISAETAQKVLQAVEVLGYTRNQTAANLRNQYSRTIGLIVNGIDSHMPNQLIAGISNTLEECGYMLFLTQCQYQDSLFHLKLKTLQEKGVDGILFASVNNTLDLSQLDLENSVPMVCIADHDIAETIDSVAINNSQASFCATEHLIQQGHRRIAYVGGVKGTACWNERIAGYELALKSNGLSKSILVVEDNNQNIEQTLHSLFTQHAQVSAVVCHDADVAVAVMNLMNRLGKNIGQSHVLDDHVALISIGEYGASSFSDLGIMTVQTDLYSVGQSAALRMMAKIERPHSPIEKMLINSTLI